MIENAIPQKFDDYIGQNKAKKVLQTVLSSIEKQIQNLTIARNQESLFEAAMYMPPSILIIGPPGYGKTRLAQIYSNEIYNMSQKNLWPLWAQNVKGTKNYGKQTWTGPGLPTEPYFFASVEGKDLKAPTVLDHYFYYLQIQGVLFIDECQSIPSKMHEHFLRIMTEQKYQSEIANRLMEHFGFTLIGATTHDGEIFRPFLERFKLVIMMEPYTQKDLAEIIIHYCNKLGYSIATDAIDLLVDRSRDNPRTITQNLDMLFMMIEPGYITIKHALEATELRGIGIHGLMERDVNILKVLGDHGPIGKNIIADMIDSVDIKNYEISERYLLNKGFVIPTSKGRILTGKGQKILKELQGPMAYD